MTRPFEGIRIIDITHVLAGPFAAYPKAVARAAEQVRALIPLRDLRGRLGNWLSWVALRPRVTPPARSRRRSNWDERLPRWCSARR